MALVQSAICLFNPRIAKRITEGPNAAEELNAESVMYIFLSVDNGKRKKIYLSRTHVESGAAVIAFHTPLTLSIYAQ